MTNLGEILGYINENICGKFEVEIKQLETENHYAIIKIIGEFEWDFPFINNLWNIVKKAEYCMTFEQNENQFFIVINEDIP